MTLRMEFVKLRRPLTLALLLLAAVLSALSLIQAQSQAQSAKKTVTAMLQYQAANGSSPFTVLGQDGRRLTCDPRKTYASADPCAALTAQQNQGFAGQLAQYESHVAAGSLAQNPVGAGAQAGGAMASLLGFVVVIILAAGHIGGEWSGKTLRNVSLQEPSRVRILCLKALSLWLASVGITVAVWIALAALGIAYRLAAPLDPNGVPGFHATDGLLALGKAVLVLAVYWVFGTTLAVLTRGVIGTLTAGLAVGVGSLMLGYVFTWASHHEFIYWVTGVMGYTKPEMSGTGNYWLTTFAIHADDASLLGGALGMAILCSACAAVASVTFKRSDLLL